MKAPALETTSLGYEYTRCRANGSDDTAYIHRLCFVAWNGFDALPTGHEVHHRLNIPWVNCETDPRTPAGQNPQLIAVDPDPHYRYHLHGQELDADASLGAGA